MSRVRNTARWGNSDVIMLKPSDKADMDISIGKDQVDIEDIRIIKHKREFESSLPNNKQKTFHAHKRGGK